MVPQKGAPVCQASDQGQGTCFPSSQLTTSPKQTAFSHSTCRTDWGYLMALIAWPEYLAALFLADAQALKPLSLAEVSVL